MSEDVDMEDSMVEPLLEMSQDCIVEWNEVHPVTDVPLGTTPITESSSHGVVGLDEVRRKLEDDKIDRGEEEINALLNILRKDNRGGMPAGVSPSAVATQRTKNPRKDDLITIRPKSKKTSLASRCRRQRQQMPPLLSNKRQCTTEPTGDGRPCQTPPPTTKEGAFDSLLRQLKHSPNRSTPQLSLDKEVASLVVASPPLMENDAQAKTDTSNAVTSRAQVSPQGINNNASSSAIIEKRSHVPIAQRTNPPTTSNAPPVTDDKTKISPNEIKSQSSTSHLKDEEDEFGSFPFDQVDMSCLDQLLSIQSSQQNVAIAPGPKGSLVDKPKTDTVVESLKPLPVQSNVPRNILRDSANTSFVPAAQNEKKQTSVKVLTQPPIVEDEFGEFPDVDFDEIEHAIASRQNEYEPLHQEVIKNPRIINGTNSGLSFIKFSRYKVLQVEQDSIQFRKTLQLAEWTNKMTREHDEKSKIHRNSRVETATESGGQMMKPAHLIPPNINYPTAGYLQLRGQWYYTAVEEGDEIHICSLTGQYRTDASALPLVLHSHPPTGSDHDDLVIIHHPDLLMTPTVVSETVSCPRRAVLKQRNGSTGLTSKSALIGTLRHSLFGACIKEQNFEKHFVVRQAKKIVRENAETMLGCGVTTQEAEKQLIDTLPVILAFVNDHTTLLAPHRATSFPTTFVNGHIGGNTGVRFAAHSTYSIEEPVISPELALKGYVDAVLETTTASPGNENDRFQQTISGLKHSLMALELKTGHNQTSQHTHMGQLSLYTLMLQCRYGVPLNANNILTKAPSTTNGKPDPRGAASGGLLLYLNHESFKATHVAPEFDEFKSLIGQRNVIAAEFVKSSRPRGVLLRYEEDKSKDDDIDQVVTLVDPAPPVELPDVQQSEHSCTRCFENRSCMLYARSEIEWRDISGVGQSHRELLKKFAGHLQRDDIEYFRKWDRLIDLEAHATVGNIATAWLVDSREREKKTGETISSLVYDGATPSVQGSGALLRFRRAASSVNHHNLDTLSIGKGSHVVISTDGCVFDDSQSDPTLEYMNTQSERKKFRHHMHIVRGFLEEATANDIVVSAQREDLDRIREMCSRFKRQPGGDAGALLTFRLDKDNSSVGIGTLRQNLINLFTADHACNNNAELTKLDVARQRRLPRLRDFIVRLDAPSFVSMDDESLFRALGPPLSGCDVAVLSQEFHALNDDQQNAIRKVMSANDYTLIQGLPGTGKTSTLAFIARLLAARGKRVLITSYTNTAVDNVVLKLLDSGVGAVNSDSGLSTIVRVGPRHSCHEIARTVHVSDMAVSFENKLLGNDPEVHLSQSSTNQLPRVESLQHVMSQARIVCSTVLTVPRSPFLVNESFDTVIVDEAGQTSQPAILGALMLADAFVLVGDHKQLPPLVTSEIAQAGGYGESMLMRLAEAHPLSVAALTYQYRMNEDICKLSSYLIYGGMLKCGSEEVRQRKLYLPGFPTALPPTVSQTKGYWPWLKMAVSPEFPVIFVDTDNLRKKAPTSNTEKVFECLEETKGGRAGGRVTNPTEATLVRYMLHGLVSVGASLKDIGVISPFRAQVQHLDDDCKLTDWRKAGLEISTIDRYQGRDKDVIILSFVRSNPDGNVGRLLQDKRRLNVALTRAKSKLIILGSFSTLKSGSVPLRPLLGRINSKGQRQLLPENALECYQFP